MHRRIEEGVECNDLCTSSCICMSILRGSARAISLCTYACMYVYQYLLPCLKIGFGTASGGQCTFRLEFVGNQIIVVCSEMQPRAVVVRHTLGASQHLDLRMHVYMYTCICICACV
jgi:hypothetical protein